MRIDRKGVEKLCSMNDERMWGAIKLFAGVNGIDLSKKRVGKEDIRNLRTALRSLTDGDLERVNRFIHTYKYGR